MIKKVNPDEFNRIFMTNLFCRLLDSYVTDDKNIETVLSKNGIVFRGPDFDEKIKSIAQQLAELFLKKFDDENKVKVMLSDHKRLEEWILDTVKRIE